MSTTPYADSTYCDTYMSERLGSDAWDAATPTNKNKALKHATRLIDTLAFTGEKTDIDQAREFPREGDTDIPTEVKDACCEVALALLAGKTLEATEEQGGIVSEAIGDVSASYGEGGAGSLTANHAGIPSAEAYRLLAPWLIDERRIHLDRAG